MRVWLLNTSIIWSLKTLSSHTLRLWFFWFGKIIFQMNVNTFLNKYFWTNDGLDEVMETERGRKWWQFRHRSVSIASSSPWIKLNQARFLPLACHHLYSWFNQLFKWWKARGKKRAVPSLISFLLLRLLASGFRIRKFFLRIRIRIRIRNPALTYHLFLRPWSWSRYGICCGM